MCPGPVGVFQDLPLSLQIMVTKTFFDVMSRDVGATASSNMTDSSAAGCTGDVATGSQSRESLKSVIKAGNEMLIWLSEVCVLLDFKCVVCLFIF